MKLGKPPVVQVSIEFHFESSPTEPAWEFTRSAEFIDQFRDQYPEAEVASEHQLAEVQKLDRGTKPTLVAKQVPVAVRAFPTNRSRYVLHSKDFLLCVFARTGGNDYEGFPALKAEAMSKLLAYLAFFRPAKLIGVALRYVDFFRIPVVEGKAELEDFFTICSEPDERTFGTTVVFRKAFTTRLPGSDDILTCELYNVPRPKDEAALGIPFRMEWGLHVTKNITWEGTSLADRLEMAHDRLTDCFRQSFTPVGWALFEPVDETP